MVVTNGRSNLIQAQTTTMEFTGVPSPIKRINAFVKLERLPINLPEDAVNTPGSSGSSITFPEDRNHLEEFVENRYSFPFLTI